MANRKCRKNFAYLAHNMHLYNSKKNNDESTSSGNRTAEQQAFYDLSKNPKKAERTHVIFYLDA